MISVTRPNPSPNAEDRRNARPAWVSDPGVPSLSPYAYQVGRSLVLAKAMSATPCPPYVPQVGRFSAYEVTGPYKPRDKAKVEVGVQAVQRWILARLRHGRFFSLAELNAAIAELVEQLNDRTMRGWGTTRRALFERFDRPALLRLPEVAYEYAEWRRCRVGLDYHVGIDKHFYSVPHQLLRQEVEARITWEHIAFSGDFLWDRAAATAAHRQPLNLGQGRMAA